MGSFYARFDGKEALLDHLESRIWTDATERWREAVAEGRLEGEDPVAVLEGVVRLLLLADRTHARQRRALAGRAVGSAGSDDGGAAAFLRTVRKDVRQALLDGSGAIRHRDPGAAVDFAFRALLGAIREMGEGAPGDAPELDDRGLTRELTRMVTAYLGMNGPRDREGVEQVEFFDVWG